MGEWQALKSVVAVTRMKNIEYRIGDGNIDNSPMPVFSDEICLFVQNFGKMILQDIEARRYPDVISVGFWCRGGNIQ